MQTFLAGVAAILQLFSISLSHTLPEQLRSGNLLRFHVVAQDDTEEMQRIKLCVRDAVHDCYAASQTDGRPMLEEAQRLLPQLTQAAVASAYAEGFSGDIRVILGTQVFSDRILGQHVIPAGEYPALMVFLGDAQGHNWWGLLDPNLSLEMSSIPQAETDDEIEWDWSFWGLLRALFRIPASEGKGA